jgi:hypothetical protein
MSKYLLLAIVLSANFHSGFTQSSRREADLGTPIVLRGTIIAPEGVIKHGYVAIVTGRIVSVSDKQPDFPDAISVNTHSIILPGFVDVHNHLAFNVLPRWRPGKVFTNRNQWRTDPDYLRIVADPVNKLRSSHFCDMNAWAELRALVGGTTSIMTTQAEPCIHGLVRNLDLNSGFYGTTELDREHIFNVLDLPPENKPSERAAFVGAARFFIANPFYEGLFIHLAEGTDATAEEEFAFVRSQSLLNPKGAIIHGIPLSAIDFQAMASNGTALVWSPRSNLELYGQTANIHAALDAGVEIALAPDWAVTGSSNMLAELKFAARWNQEQLGGRLTNRQFVDMVTSTPAHTAGIDDEVGAIRAGLRADILVINGDHNDPYRAVVDATETDVELVFIDGVPLYGDRTLMEHFWKRSELEEIDLSGVSKTLATAAANINAASIKNRLRRSLDSVGASLAPLTEPDVFEASTASGAGVSRREEKNSPGKLAVTALPNPSMNNFTLRIQSSSSEMLSLSVLDVLGRVVETKNRIAPNKTFQIGNNIQPGVYFVEVMQGTERQLLKLIRQ